MKPCDRKKVLFILPTLGAGGAERILVTLMNNIDRNQFHPVFLALNDDGPIKDWIADDVAFHSLGKRSVKNSILPVISFIKTHRPDVIFTTMVHSNALALIMKIFFPRIRVIIREAALPSVLVSRYGIKGRACLPVYKLLYRYADLVISNCSQMVDDFRQKIKIRTDNHQILFNPVDTARVYASIPDAFENIPDRDQTICFVCVGRLSYEKGYDRLFEALIHFHPAVKWRLDIIGDGDYKQTLEELIKQYRLEKHIFLRGYESNPWKIAAKADCLLLPSRWEGMPNVVLEGFSCGVPAIATRESGGIMDIAEYTDDANLQIVDTMDEFIDAMRRVDISPKTSRAQSILPDAFLLPNIMSEFEKML